VGSAAQERGRPAAVCRERCDERFSPDVQYLAVVCLASDGGDAMTRLPARQSGEASFAVHVRFRCSASPADEARFQRRTEDWLTVHGLSADGAQTTFAVLAERELSANDQANTLLAMLDDPAVRQVRVGPIVTEGEGPTDKDSCPLWVEADLCDPLVHAARVLYEAGRLDGIGFLEALGSYIHRPSEQSRHAPEELR